MFAVFTRTRPKGPSAQPRWARPAVERLETRDAPSSLLTTEPVPGLPADPVALLTADLIAPASVPGDAAVSGPALPAPLPEGAESPAVLDSAAPGILAESSSGVPSPNPAPAGPGDVDTGALLAVMAGFLEGGGGGGGGGGGSYMTDAASTTSTGPILRGFQAVHDSDNLWYLRGEVQDLSPLGCVVVFDGQIASIQGSTTAVFVDGSGYRFNAGFELAPGEHGTVSAQVINPLGQRSNIEWDYI